MATETGFVEQRGATRGRVQRPKADACEVRICNIMLGADCFDPQVSEQANWIDPVGQGFMYGWEQEYWSGDGDLK